jgi:putative RecB family exonuclease
MNSVIAAPKLRVMSHSQMQQYEDCPYQWWLQREARDDQGQRLRPMTAAWFHHGTAVHEVAEYGFKHGWNFDVRAAFYTVYDRLIAEYRRRNPYQSEWLRGGRKGRDEDIAQRRELGADQAVRLAEWAPNQPWSIWRLPTGVAALEVGFLLRLGDVMVRGYIDAVWQWNDGSVDVVDWKTGTKTPSTDDQLGLYKLALEELCGAEVRAGRYMMLRDWTAEERDLSAYTRESLTAKYAAAAAGIEARMFPAQPGGCFTCTMKKHCDFAQ